MDEAENSQLIIITKNICCHLHVYIGSYRAYKRTVLRFKQSGDMLISLIYLLFINYSFIISTLHSPHSFS